MNLGNFFFSFFIIFQPIFAYVPTKFQICRLSIRFLLFSHWISFLWNWKVQKSHCTFAQFTRLFPPNYRLIFQCLIPIFFHKSNEISNVCSRNVIDLRTNFSFFVILEFGTFFFSFTSLIHHSLPSCFIAPINVN